MSYNIVLNIKLIPNVFKALKLLLDCIISSCKQER